MLSGMRRAWPMNSQSSARKYVYAVSAAALRTWSTIDSGHSHSGGDVSRARTLEASAADDSAATRVLNSPVGVGTWLDWLVLSTVFSRAVIVSQSRRASRDRVGWLAALTACSRAGSGGPAWHVFGRRARRRADRRRPAGCAAPGRR